MNGDNYQVNPAGQAYLALYHSEWNSTATLELDQARRFQARVFHGDYRLVLCSGDTVLEEKIVTLEKGADLDITLEP